MFFWAYLTAFIMTYFNRLTSQVCLCKSRKSKLEFYFWIVLLLLCTYFNCSSYKELDHKISSSLEKSSTGKMGIKDITHCIQIPGCQLPLIMVALSQHCSMHLWRPQLFYASKLLTSQKVKPPTSQFIKEWLVA